MPLWLPPALQVKKTATKVKAAAKPKVGKGQRSHGLKLRPEQHSDCTESHRGMGSGAAAVCTQPPCVPDRRLRPTALINTAPASLRFSNRRRPPPRPPRQHPRRRPPPRRPPRRRPRRRKLGLRSTALSTVVVRCRPTCLPFPNDRLPNCATLSPPWGLLPAVPLPALLPSGQSQCMTRLPRATPEERTLHPQTDQRPPAATHF